MNVRDISGDTRNPPAWGFAVFAVGLLVLTFAGWFGWTTLEHRILGGSAHHAKRRAKGVA